MQRNQTNLECVILCGGKGSRIKKYFPLVPKILIKIKKKPFIFYKLKNLTFVKKFIFCTGYKSKYIKKYCEKNLNKKKYIFSNEKNPLGTGGSLKKALNKIKGKYFFFTWGDNYLLELPFKKMISLAKKRNKSNMLIFKNKNRYEQSNISVKKNLISKYDKKNNHQKIYIDYGFFYLKKDDLTKIMTLKKKFDFKIILKKLIMNKLIDIIIVKKRFYEIGKIEGFNDFRKYLKNYSTNLNFN